MPFGIAGNPNGEIQPPGLRLSDQVRGMSEAAGIQLTFRLKIASEGQYVVDIEILQNIECSAYFVHGSVDACQMGNRLYLELLLDDRGDRDGSSSGQIVGVVRHRDECRIVFHQDLHGIEDVGEPLLKFHSLFGPCLGWEDLKREPCSFAFFQYPFYPQKLTLLYFVYEILTDNVFIR